MEIALASSIAGGIGAATSAIGMRCLVGLGFASDRCNRAPIRDPEQRGSTELQAAPGCVMDQPIEDGIAALREPLVEMRTQLIEQLCRGIAGAWRCFLASAGRLL